MRPCTVCNHPRRAEIDRALTKGERSERALAAEFGVPKTSLHRHKVECAGLKAKDVQSLREAQKEISRGTVALASLPSRDELGSMYLALGQRIDGIVDAATRQGSLAVAINGLNALRGTLDSLGKLAGHTYAPPQVHIGIKIDAATIAEGLAARLKTIDAEVIEEIVGE